MDESSCSAWFEGYLEAFAAAGRGEREAASVIDRYAIPLALANADQFVSLTSPEQVLAVVEGQIDGMRAEDYERTDVLSLDLRVLSRKAAVVEASFVRLRCDRSEIARHTATYLLAEPGDSIQIAALCLHAS